MVAEAFKLAGAVHLFPTHMITNSDCLLPNVPLIPFAFAGAVARDPKEWRERFVSGYFGASGREEILSMEDRSYSEDRIKGGVDGEVWGDGQVKNYWYCDHLRVKNGSILRECMVSVCPCWPHLRFCLGWLCRFTFVRLQRLLPAPANDPMFVMWNEIWIWP